MRSSLPPPPVVESCLERRWKALIAQLTAEFVRDCAQGAVSLADLPRLAAVDPLELDDAARVDLIEAFERVRAQVDGLQQRALGAVIEATEAVGLDGDAARHEVGAALRLSPVTAYARTKVAADLVRRLPATLAALQAGDICYLQAKAVATAVADLPPDVRAETVARIEERVLEVAPGQTVAETKRTVERAVIAADPTSAQDRHEKATARRSIERHVLPDAMEGWWVTMPAPAAVAAWAEITRRARATQAALRAGAGDDPGLDALRVDTLLDTLLGHETSPPPADPTTTEAPEKPGTAGTPATAGDGTAGGPGTAAWAGRMKPVPRCRCGGAQTAAVVVDLPTLLGLAEHPGELPGYGPIPPGLARELGRDRDWVRWTVDPGTRRLLDRGARRYRPSARMRAYLAAAQRSCGFPGCHRRAEQCDTDHRVSFRRGGKTIVRNLGPLCRQHHNAKTHGRWTLTYDDDTGCKTWTSPLGKTYTKGTDPPLL